jgi:hypothetical protein
MEGPLEGSRDSAAMLDGIRGNSQSQRQDAAHRLRPGCAVSDSSRNGFDFSDPCTIGYPAEYNVQLFGLLRRHDALSIKGANQEKS